MGDSVFHVYTHFYPYRSEERFTEGKQKGTLKGCRWRTLLQIGDSWGVLGSAVMMNPGSSYFAEGLDMDHPILDPVTLDALKRFDSSEDDWFEFEPDKTMEQLAGLFAHYYGIADNGLFASAKTAEDRKDYIGKLTAYGEKLQGVIQIFNLANHREPNLPAALNAIQDVRPHEEMLDTARKDVELLIPPVYYGFKSWIRQRAVAPQVAVHRECAPRLLGLSDDVDPFETFPCYHPSYIFGWGKGSQACWEALEAFRAAR